MTRPDISSPVRAPLSFLPEFETPGADEAQTIAELVAVLGALRTAADARRNGSAGGSPGVVRGEMAVFEDLTPDLRQGVFAEPLLFPVILRCAAGSHDGLWDGVLVPRGLSVRIVGVEGERLPGSVGETTQDFILADAPAFAARDAGDLLKTLKRRTGASGASRVVERPRPAGLESVEAILSALGRGNARPAIPAQRDPHLLGTTFFSQMPVLYGAHVAKIALVPACPDLLSLAGEAMEVAGRPHAMDEAVEDFFESQTAVWDLRVQLMTDRRAMPIEDASTVWPEGDSPYRTVARITVPPQPMRKDASREGAGPAPVFSPWRGLAAHRPLGSIMRARRAIDAMPALVPAG